MKNSLWKLTALLGVVGIVLLAFVQAQRGLDHGSEDEFVAEEEFVEPQLGEAAPAPGGEDVAMGASVPVDGSAGDAPAWPADGDVAEPEPESEPSGASVPIDDPWSADEPPRRVVSPESTPSPSADPFGENEFTADDGRSATGSERESPSDSDADFEPEPFAPEPGRVVLVDGERAAEEPRRLDFEVGDADDSSMDAVPPKPISEPEPLPLDEETEAGSSFEEERTATGSDPRFDEFEPFAGDRASEGEASSKDLEPDTATIERTSADELDEAADPAAESEPFPPFADSPPEGPEPRDESDLPAPEPFDPFGDGPADEPTDEPMPQPPHPHPLGEPEDHAVPETTRVLPRESFDEEPQDGPSLSLPGFSEEPAAEPEAVFDPDADPGTEAVPAPAIDSEPALDAEADGDHELGEAAVEADPPAATTAAEPKRWPEETTPESPARIEPPADVAPVDERAPERERLIGDGVVGAGAPDTAEQPRLTIEKTAPPNAVLGQPLVYTIVVKNVGESSARRVVVEDRIPKGTELTGTIPRAELVEKTLRWKLGTLEPGATKKIAVRVVPLAEGQVGSIATVNFVAEVAARTRVSVPKLELTVDAPEKVRRGEPVPLNFVVKNHGSSAATGVLLRNLVPGGLQHPGGDDLEYPVGDLAAGESRTVKLTLTAAQAGHAVNRAILTAAGGATSEATARIEVAGSTLAVSRTGPAKRYVGRPGVYSNVVTNHGDEPLAEVTVVERLPEGLEFVEADSGGQYNPGRREIAWRIDRLGPRESQVLKVKLVARHEGEFSSDLKATANGGESAEASAAVAAVGFASLALDVDGGTAPLVVGDTLPFTITPRNRGSATASGLSVVVELSPELELVSANAPVEYEQTAEAIRFSPLTTLDGGDEAAYELRFRAVKPGDARIRTRIEADQLTRPLQRDEAILVVPESP